MDNMRMAALEKSIRQLKIIIGGLVAFLMLVFAVAAGPDAQEIRARKLSILDDSGNVVAVIESGENGGVVRLASYDGEDRKVDLSGSGLILLERGKIIGKLVRSSSSKATSISLCNMNGETTVEMLSSASTGDGHIILRKSNGAVSWSAPSR